MKTKNIDLDIKIYFRDSEKGIKKTRFTFRDDSIDDLSFRDCLNIIMNWLLECKSKGNKLVFIGNGGSAAICSHMAIDFTNAGKMRAIDFNSGPLITCLANDYGFENFFAKAIEIHGRKDDIIMAISSSGKSKDILCGVEAGKNLGCQVVTLSGFNQDNPLFSMGDINIY